MTQGEEVMLGEYSQYFGEHPDEQPEDYIGKTLDKDGKTYEITRVSKELAVDGRELIFAYGKEWVNRPMKAGLIVKNEYGVKTVLDKTRPLKILGTFRTRSDQHIGSIVDSRIEGKDIAIFPLSTKLIAAGSTNMYMFPSNIGVRGNTIYWEYVFLRPTSFQGYFLGMKETMNGTNTVYEVEYGYGYY